MIVVASIWEMGWNTPIKEFDLWHYPLRDLGVDELAMTPVSGISKRGVKEFHNVEELVQHYGLPVIVCSEKGESGLVEFKHPKDALYLFNRTSGGVLPVEPSHSIRITTVENKGLLWGHQAASIILYDRLVKDGNNNSR